MLFMVDIIKINLLSTYCVSLGNNQADKSLLSLLTICNMGLNTMQVKEYYNFK